MYNGDTIGAKVARTLVKKGGKAPSQPDGGTSSTIAKTISDHGGKVTAYAAAYTGLLF